MQKKIFVDCFNTLIKRTVSDKDVLLRWSKALGDTYEYPPEFFYRAFHAAQKKLGTRAFWRTGETEYTFREIAAWICARMDGTDSDEFYETALSLYRNAEMSCHRRNDALFQRLAALKRDGCSLFLVSDFYCGEETVRAFLRNLGADVFDGIFVSCDCKRSKRTGALYRYALKKTGARRRETLMIGDNPFTDVLMARMNLLHAEKYASRPPEKSAELNAFLKKSPREREYDEIFAANGKRYTFSNYAFPLYLFTKRLYERFRAAGGTDLFFCSREGQFMKKLFDAYCAYHGYEVNTHYLYASRNSVAGLTPLAEEDFSYIKKISPLANATTFLTSLSFSKEQIETVLLRLGIKKDRKSMRFYRSQTYRNLLADEAFRRIYEENRLKNAAAFETYMNGFGADLEKNGLFMVDVGWRGGVQYYIDRYYHGRVKVYGYYIGLSEQASDKEGLLWTVADRKPVGNALFHHRIVDYEQILRADHDRVAGYELVGNEARIVFGNELDNRRIYGELIAPMQEQIYEKFLRIMRNDCKHADFEITTCKYFRAMMCRVSRQDAEWLEHCEGTHYDYFVRVGLTYQKWGHIVRFYHGAQKALFRMRSHFCCPKAKNPF